MRYENPQLRDKLAAEYVLGTLTGRVRMRFQQLLKYDIELRHSVGAWEKRLVSLAELVPAITPPARVWRAIAARIGGKRDKAGLWASLGLWRGFAVASTAFLLVLAGYIAIAPLYEPPVSMMAVLADDKATPSVVVSWPEQQSERSRYLKIKVQTHPEMAANTAWELWMIPQGKERPVSLGLIGVEPAQTIRLSTATSQVIGKSWGLAISIEPTGGSPTGQPTGPVIMQGPCVKII